MAKYCENCGSEIGSNANFCANCGASINGQTGYYDSTQNQKSNTAKTVATAAGTAVGVSLLGKLFRRRRRPPMYHVGGHMPPRGHMGGPMGGPMGRHRGPGGPGGHGGPRGRR